MASRFSEEQIIAILKEAEAEPVKTVCARHNNGLKTSLECAIQQMIRRLARRCSIYSRSQSLAFIALEVVATVALNTFSDTKSQSADLTLLLLGFGCIPD